MRFVGWLLGTLVGFGLTVAVIVAFDLDQAGAVLVGASFGGVCGSAGMAIGARS